ncbi:MAG: preprotein translocase subunit SecY, partial [Thermoplasmata archaeon]
MVEVTDKIPRKRGVSVIVAILFIATIYVYISYIAGKLLSLQSFYSIYMAQWLPNTVILLLLAPLYYILYLILSYNGDKKSKLYGLKPLVERLPSVIKPDRHVLFREKLFWTGTVLILYFALTNIFIYGLNTSEIIDVFASFRAILAGASGTLMQLGIGPIVTASIIMQLFVGAKII